MATRLLASVRDATEAQIALAGGADIIDLKEPELGSLGAVAPEVVEAVIAQVAGRAPVSAVAGDLPMEPGPILDAVMARRAADFVKIGFFPAGMDAWQAVCDRLATEAPGVARIAVLFADDGVTPGFISLLRQAGFAGAMLDTRVKDGRRLVDHLSLAAIADFVDEARANGLLTGLAGSLEAPDVPRLLPLGADYLGFRGALTQGGRTATIDAARVARLASMLRGAPAARPDAPLDRVFMRDFVQEMEIGAYGFERGRTQKVRFTIEAMVRRASASPQDVGEVYSYDLMMDAVRRLVARGHTDLVETLAEELAATVLADTRVESVLVRVEKLDLGPGAAGIEICRRREDACGGAAWN